MTRPADLTRHSLIEEAIDVFAAKGFEGGSVRAITQRAKANQAAINYHFGSKEGLYREVLKISIEAFSEKALLTPEMVDELDSDEVMRLFIRQQLQPLLKNRRASRYVPFLDGKASRRARFFRNIWRTNRFQSLFWPKRSFAVTAPRRRRAKRS